MNGFRGKPGIAAAMNTGSGSRLCMSGEMCTQKRHIVCMLSGSCTQGRRFLFMGNRSCPQKSGFGHMSAVRRGLMGLMGAVWA